MQWRIQMKINRNQHGLLLWKEKHQTSLWRSPMGLPLLKETVRLTETARRKRLSGIEDFSTEQPHFDGMCQEGADEDLPRLCGLSDGECVSVMRSGEKPEPPALPPGSQDSFPGCHAHEGEYVCHTVPWQDVKVKKGRGRCSWGTKTSVGQSDDYHSAGCAGEGKAMQRRGSTQPQLQGGQKAPAQDSHAVHLPLPAAAYSLLRLSASAGIKLQCWGAMQRLPEPSATTGTGHGCWEATPQHIPKRCRSAAPGPLTGAVQPQETGAKPSHKRTVFFVFLSFSYLACKQRCELWGWFVLYLRKGTVVTSI